MEFRLKEILFFVVNCLYPNSLRSEKILKAILDFSGKVFFFFWKAKEACQFFILLRKKLARSVNQRCILHRACPTCHMSCVPSSFKQGALMSSPCLSACLFCCRRIEPFSFNKAIISAQKMGMVCLSCFSFFLHRDS